MNESPTVRFLDPNTAKRRLEEGGAVVIDIREADEFARERIEGAHSAPLSTFESHDFRAFRDKTVIFTCRSGTRTVTNAARFLAKGFREVCLLEGGNEAWKRAGLTVRTDRRVPIDLMRQVQIAVGAMVLAGALLTLVSPWFALIPGFAGAGLLAAGTTGFCGMTRVLRLMPWNRAPLAPAG
ncbi:MAG: rhodanese-like domain-containing protein [Alphaproteobacteria bacterium]